MENNIKKEKIKKDRELVGFDMPVTINVKSPENIKTLTKIRRAYLGLPFDFKIGDGGISGGLDFIREVVRSRDNRTCKICLKKWNIGERRFDVHHLDEVNGKSAGSLRSSKYDRENLDRMITLCHKCHIQLHYSAKKNKTP